MKLSPTEIARIRDIAERVRRMKEKDYDGITWEQAKLKVANEEASGSTDEHYKILALLDYFLDEERALCSLHVFLESADDIVANLRARDLHYAIGTAEREQIRSKVDAYLNRVGMPSTSEAAFDYYQVLIDRVFTSTTYPNLLDTIARLGATLERWYPKAFLEAQFIGKSKADLLRLSELAFSPITLASASALAGHDFSGLKQHLHRFIDIGLFSKVQVRREVQYVFLTPKVDTNLLRREWSWLWSSPGQRLSLGIYEDKSRR
jgi:hypothetical protein